MASSTYAVTGMTCEHCVASVTEQVSALDGVTDVRVDLDTGRLAVTGERVDMRAVLAAVAEAGYQAVVS